MKQLTKDHLATKSQIEQDLEAREAALVQAINDLNEHLNETATKIEALQDEYNTAVGAANEFRESVLNDQEAYFDDLSERQRESGNGQSYADWMSAWSGTLEEVEVEVPEALEIPDFTALEALQDLAPTP